MKRLALILSVAIGLAQIPWADTFCACEAKGKVHRAEQCAPKPPKCGACKQGSPTSCMIKKAEHQPDVAQVAPVHFAMYALVQAATPVLWVAPQPDKVLYKSEIHIRDPDIESHQMRAPPITR